MVDIIIIGAHPDDPDKVGGTAYKWAQMGYDVLMVSLTNGDAGHQSIKAEELAKIRREEAKKEWSSANSDRDKLIELYGKDRGSKIKYCEAFQDSGYGAPLTKENISYYFPFLQPQ